ncbi:reverse transcriptase [Cucumis melo var. makuwa]|uniref:Reverse transcriptase n=1 Tax=Cucumis melo var. makuwa TaxID=1194695 RepID=A0A5A7UNA6_CUCMM|nr:reverse transcriptase [Cucumis melo var. makuwa]
MVDSGATHNFITEAEARCLRLHWEKDSGRMKVVNYVALPIVGLVKQVVIRLRGWKGPIDFVVVKMDDFDVVLDMEFLLEHQEPSSAVILLGALEKLGETVPKDTLTIDHGIELLLEAKASAKNAYRMAPPELAKLWKPSKMLLNTGFSRPVQAPYGFCVLSLKKKEKNPQQGIDRRIQSKLTVRCKYSLPTLTRRFDRPCRVKYFPKSNIRPRYCRVRAMKVEGLETTCVTRLGAYEFSMVPFNLTNAKEGKCCSVQSQINVLGHVVKRHQIELLREEDTLWSGNLECQATFNALKQVMREGPSLGVVDATKPPKVEAEQFNCVLGEYLHPFVDGRQKNWVQLLNVTQFGRNAEIDSLIKRSPFEIKDSGHSVLSLITDDPYIGNNPQVHRVEDEWEQMADIA